MAPIELLPNAILVDIILCVIAGSYIDFISLKSTSKRFLMVCEDKHIYKNASFDEIPISPWWPLRDEVRLFLDHCFQHNNPESFFRRGLVESFKERNEQLGFRYLKEASKRGHLGALYAHGILLLYNYNYLGIKKQLGMRIVSNFIKERSTEEKIRCRRLLVDFLKNNYWPKYYFFFRKPDCCPLRVRFKMNEWEFPARYSKGCDECLCDLELTVIHQQVLN